jgi:hypothetical protein
MNPEFHLHDYSNEPRLRDMPRSIVNAAHPCALAHSSLSNDHLTRPARKHLPLLSILFTLWIPGSLQTWRAQGFFDGWLARIAMQPVQPRRL